MAHLPKDSLGGIFGGGLDHRVGGAVVEDSDQVLGLHARLCGQLPCPVKAIPAANHVLFQQITSQTHSFT